MKKSDCHDFYELTDKSHLCKHHSGHPHCICENMIRFNECPKGCTEEE